MELLVHVTIFIASIGIVWFFAGVLIAAVTKISQHYCITGFFTAFFLLGFLTSISEFSVAANSLLIGHPGISVGNLIGGSFVVLLFIVPLLAAAGQGIHLNRAVSHGSLLFILAVVALPAVLALDGSISRTEGWLALFAYAAVAYALYLRRVPINSCEPEEPVSGYRWPPFAQFARVLVGGVAIFAGAHFLVGQAEYFATALSVSPALVGLVLLSVGTNVPEIVIAIRALHRGRTDIAFGDYLGSAAMNTLIFGLVAIFSGSFVLFLPAVALTTILLVAGLGALYVFSRTGEGLSRTEGLVLLVFYVTFLALQTYLILG